MKEPQSLISDSQVTYQKKSLVTQTILVQKTTQKCRYPSWGSLGPPWRLAHRWLKHLGLAGTLCLQMGFLCNWLGLPYGMAILRWSGFLTGQFALTQGKFHSQNMEVSAFLRHGLRNIGNYIWLHLTAQTLTSASFKVGNHFCKKGYWIRRSITVIAEAIFHIGRGEWHWFFGRG